METFLWVEKYRPTTVDACILSNSIKKDFSKFVKEKDIPIIANELKFAGTEFLIMRGFGQPEAISLKNKVVDEFSNTFDEMIPIREFLSRTKVLTQTSDDVDPMSNEACDDFKKKGYFRILDEKLHPVPREVLLLTAGVDVQDDRLEITVCGWGREDRLWVLAHHIIYLAT